MEQKTLANAKTYCLEEYKEKMPFRKVTARQLGYVKQANEMPKVEEVLEKMAETSIEDRQYINAAVEINNKAMEKLTEAMIKQSKQMTALVAKMSYKQISRANLMPAAQLSTEEKA